MSRLARAVQIVADLARVLPAPVDYARAERTEPPTLPTLEAMANQREAAESRLHRRTPR
jgi:hypothetical protein